MIIFLKQNEANRLTFSRKGKFKKMGGILKINYSSISKKRKPDQFFKQIINAEFRKKKRNGGL